MPKINNGGVVREMTSEELKEYNKSIEEDAKSAIAYEKVKYKDERKMAYDPIPEQLDQIYHDIDGWKAKIKAVKEKYPKS